jgi:hypothetical protein
VCWWCPSFKREWESNWIEEEKLQIFHQMKNSRRVNKILGVRITWLDGSVCLNQEFYIIRTLVVFDMWSTDTETTVNPGSNLDEDLPRLSYELLSQFRHAIDRVTYLAGGTQPNF